MTARNRLINGSTSVHDGHHTGVAATEELVRKSSLVPAFAGIPSRNRAGAAPVIKRCHRDASAVCLLLVVAAAALHARPTESYDGWQAAMATGGKTATNGDTDSPMYQDPFWTPYAVVKVFNPKLKTLWIQALARPDVDTKRRAADEIGRAHLMGMPNLTDTADELALLLDHEHVIVRKSAARTLIRLNAKQNAAKLLDRNRKDDIEMVLLTDPTMVAWNHMPARAVWMARLTDEQWQVRVSAIRSLATVRHEPAAGELQKQALNNELDPSLRLVAARALGVIIHKGHEVHAERLADGSKIDRLVGASLLSNHSGLRTIELLLGMAVDPEPSVAAIALERLLEIDPLLIKPIGNVLLGNRDDQVRRLAAQAVLAQRSPEAIAVLIPLLNDLNPSVRAYVRRQLIVQNQIARLGPVIRDSVMEVLARREWSMLKNDATANRIKCEWRGLEQASMVLGAVDHEPAASDLVDLLEYPRLEVRVAAAVALRRVQVPQVLPRMLDYAKRFTKSPLYFGRRLGSVYEIDEPLAQLMQSFGQVRYRPAEPLMIRHIPKQIGANARSAAIWALGHLYENTPNDGLAAMLAGRITDIGSILPEHPFVRRMSAVTIGRMKASSQLAVLEQYFEIEFDNDAMAPGLAWSIERTTGKRLNKHGPLSVSQTDWFLSPK